VLVRFLLGVSHSSSYRSYGRWVSNVSNRSIIRSITSHVLHCLLRGCILLLGLILLGVELIEWVLGIVVLPPLDGSTCQQGNLRKSAEAVSFCRITRSTCLNCLLREVVVLREVALAAEELVVAVVRRVVQGLRGYGYLTADGQAHTADGRGTSASFMRDGKIVPEESLEF